MVKSKFDKRAITSRQNAIISRGNLPKIMKLITQPRYAARNLIEWQEKIKTRTDLTNTQRIALLNAMTRAYEAVFGSKVMQLTLDAKTVPDEVIERIRQAKEREERTGSIQPEATVSAEGDQADEHFKIKEEDD